MTTQDPRWDAGDAAVASTAPTIARLSLLDVHAGIHVVNTQAHFASGSNRLVKSIDPIAPELGCSLHGVMPRDRGDKSASGHR